MGNVMSRPIQNIKLAQTLNYLEKTEFSALPPPCMEQVLYLIDMCFFQTLKKKHMGLDYTKAKRGVKIYKYKRIKQIKKPLSIRQMMIVNLVLDKIKNKTPEQIFDYVDEDVPVQWAEEDELINYYHCESRKPLYTIKPESIQQAFPFVGDSVGGKSGKY